MFEKKIRLEENFLDVVPVRKVEWDHDEQGKVYLKKEKTRNKLMKKIIDLSHKSQFINIHLDQLGTSAWLLVDGKRNVRRISEMMKTEFNEDLRKLEERLGFFFALLKKNNFIDLTQ
ncbi:hypothetical protein ACFLRB_00135 [Acidobacteriota bacterium]